MRETFHSLLFYIDKIAAVSHSGFPHYFNTPNRNDSIKRTSRFFFRVGTKAMAKPKHNKTKTEAFAVILNRVPGCLHILKPAIYHLHIKMLVALSFSPIFHKLMIWMVRVFQNRKEILKSGLTADIFWRSVSFTF
jgi:hypothetical protein